MTDPTRPTEPTCPECGMATEKHTQGEQGYCDEVTGLRDDILQLASAYKNALVDLAALRAENERLTAEVARHQSYLRREAAYAARGGENNG